MVFHEDLHDYCFRLNIAVGKFLEKKTSSEINSEFSTSDAQVFLRARCQDSRQEVNPEWYKVGPRADRFWMEVMAEF